MPQPFVDSEWRSAIGSFTNCFGNTDRRIGIFIHLDRELRSPTREFAGKKFSHHLCNGGRYRRQFFWLYFRQLEIIDRKIKSEIDVGSFKHRNFYIDISYGIRRVLRNLNREKKKMKSLITKFLIGAILINLGFIIAFAQKKEPTDQREVLIYLHKPNGIYDATDLNFFFPVKRLVDSNSPLAGALKELVKGPTEEEENLEIESTTYGIQFVSVSLKNGKVLARFTMPESARFSGENSPFIFEEAVKRTAMQFKGVKKVVVCLDGESNFGSEGGAPSKKC